MGNSNLFVDNHLKNIKQLILIHAHVQKLKKVKLKFQNKLGLLLFYKSQ